jgi:beta-lactam-binding protein with PASTA domain/Tfp pilus assembly protein PilX
MAYRQYGNVLNTLNIKAKNIFNWNTNYPDTYGYTNLNSVNAHTIIKRSGIKVATASGALLGFVPSIVGLTFDTASLILRNAGFTPDPNYIYSNSVGFQQYMSQGGYVSAQAPAPSSSSGTLLAFGSSIRMDVILYTTSPIDTSTVPNAPLWSNTSSADSSITLTFLTPANGGSPITSYEYSITNGASWINVGLPISNTFTVSSLTNGVNYTFYIRAVNLKGASASSSGVIKAPSSGSGGGAATVPGAPTFTVSFITNTSFRIDLTPPSNNGGAEIIRYQHTLNNGVTWVNDFTNTGPITVSSLNPGATFQVGLRAVNSVGNGNSSNMQSVSTTQIVPDLIGISVNSAKAIITASGYVYGDGTLSASNNQFFLDYPGGYVTAQSPASGLTLSGGGTVRLDFTQYLSAPSFGTVPSVLNLTLSEAVTRIQQAGYSDIRYITTSDPNKVYQKIYAQDPISGTSALVNTPITISYSDYTGTIAIPTNSTRPSITYDNIYVGSRFAAVPGSWTDSPTSYAYQWYDSNGNNFISANSATYTVNGSAVSRSVGLKLAATNAVGTSEYVSALNFYGPIKALSQPTLVEYGLTSPRQVNQLNLRWSGGDSPFYFIGVYKPGTSSYVTTKIVTTESTSITGLTAGTNYYVQIFGNNNNEYSSGSKISAVLSTTWPSASSTPVLNSATKSGNVINFTATKGSNTGALYMILETTSGGSVSNAVVQYFGYDQSTNNVSGAYTITDIAAGTYRLTAYGWNEDYNTSLTGSSVQLTI